MLAKACASALSGSSPAPELDPAHLHKDDLFLEGEGSRSSPPVDSWFVWSSVCKFALKLHSPLPRTALAQAGPLGPHTQTQPVTITTSLMHYSQHSSTHTVSATPVEVGRSHASRDMHAWPSTCKGKMAVVSLIVLLVALEDVVAVLLQWRQGPKLKHQHPSPSHAHTHRGAPAHTLSAGGMCMPQDRPNLPDDTPSATSAWVMPR